MARHIHKSNVRGGMTLIELIVVIFILGIAAAIVVPQVVEAGSFAAVSAARRLAVDLQYAQDEAITRQQAVAVIFASSGESYQLRNASGTLIHPITKTAYVVEFAGTKGLESVQIIAADFGGSSQVSFDSLGAPDQAGSVTLRSGNHQYRIDVAPATGKVTVSEL